jgi:hypothetical protein
MLLVEALQAGELDPEGLTCQPPGVAEYVESRLYSLEEAALDSPAVYKPAQRLRGGLRAVGKRRPGRPDP